jgi:hypothetical protein
MPQNKNIQFSSFLERGAHGSRVAGANRRGNRQRDENRTPRDVLALASGCAINAARARLFYLGSQALP